ncbi:hypothetical protein DFQ28_003077 [Apophysomyces sp. BC1034]|nr:hypothetical protein DFQ28_003077 [Apophysomyces sp. BC1034]
MVYVCFRDAAEFIARHKGEISDVCLDQLLFKVKHGLFFEIHLDEDLSRIAAAGDNAGAEKRDNLALEQPIRIRRALRPKWGTGAEWLRLNEAVELKKDDELIGVNLTPGIRTA